MKRTILFVLTMFAAASFVSCAQNQPAGDSGEKAATTVKAVKSTAQAINQISYDAADQSLILAFERGTYSFAGVPPEVHEGLLSSESRGAYYQSEIRGKYKSTRIDK